MTIFFILNGLGVAFLVYVLVNFWKDGRPAENSRRSSGRAHRDGTPGVIVLTGPISHNAHGGVSVLTLDRIGKEPVHSTERKTDRAQVLKMPTRHEPSDDWRRPTGATIGVR